MSKPSISLAIAAAVLLTTGACERTEVKEEAKDVEKAAEKVEQKEREVEQAKQELREEKAELAVDASVAINEAAKRFAALDEQATAAINALQSAGADMTKGLPAELQQAHMMAKAKLEAAKQAETPAAVAESIKELDKALEDLKKKVSEYRDEA